jgi:serine/threonine protein kinase
MATELGPNDPRRVGPYEITGVLGTGGMGRVYLARSAGGRPLAVKVIRAELADDPEFRARFRREVAAAQRVNGMFTAVVADADTDGPVPWLATAYVPGPTLAQAVTERGPLSAAAVRALAAGLAEGLAAVHAAGVVHRDLKPSNVLLADDGPRLIDFGISRRTETGKLTSTGLVVGSPGFMSPEQAEGGVAGPPSDVFSLGAVLVYAATGHGPFGGGSTAALVYRVVHAEPELEDVPETIRRLVARCLAKNAAMRPTAADLLDSLSDSQPEQGWLPDQPQARTAPPSVRTPPASVQAAPPSVRPAPPAVTRPELVAETGAPPEAEAPPESTSTPAIPATEAPRWPKTVTSATTPALMPETMPDTGLDMLDAVMAMQTPEIVTPTTRDVVLPPSAPEIDPATRPDAATSLDSATRPDALTPPGAQPGPLTRQPPGEAGLTRARPVPPMPHESRTGRAESRTAGVAEGIAEGGIAEGGSAESQAEAAPPMPWPGVTAAPRGPKRTGPAPRTPQKTPQADPPQRPPTATPTPTPTQEQVTPPPLQQEPPRVPPRGPKKDRRRLALAGVIVAVLIAVSVGIAFALSGGPKTTGSKLASSLTTHKATVQPSQDTTVASPTVNPSPTPSATKSTSPRPRNSGHTGKSGSNTPARSQTSSAPATQPATQTSSTPATQRSTAPPAPKPKPKPAPSHSTSSSAPTDLGAPDFTSWCSAQGDSVELAEPNVDGWECITSTGFATDINVTLVCIHQYDDPYAVAEYSDYNNPNSWYCESS